MSTPELSLNAGIGKPNALARDASASRYRLLVSVQSGLHQGAAFIGKTQEAVRVGSASHCDLVLMDTGVQPEALRLFEQHGRLAVEVLATGVSCMGMSLPLGIKRFETPSVPVQVGTAQLRLELLRRSPRRRSSTALTTRSPPRSAPSAAGHLAAWSLAGLVVAAAAAALGGAASVAAVGPAQQAVRPLADVLADFNARGAQLQLAGTGAGVSQIQGLVADAAMADALRRDLRAAGHRVELKLNDARLMGESLERLARLANQSCEAEHLGGGRFRCDAGLADANAVARLQALASQVPGVTALEVHAVAPVRELALPMPLPVQTAPTTKAPVVASPPAALPAAAARLPVIQHVAVGRGDSFAYDGQGRKLRVGDRVEGALITRIRFDGVEVLRDGQRFNLAITPTLSQAARGGAG